MKDDKSLGEKVSVTSGNGILVKYDGKKIALDPHMPVDADIVFVSHAHIDHVHSPHQGTKLLASKETAFLAKERGFDLRGVREEFKGFRLVESGHILGSRGILIGDEIFYTGDLTTRRRAFLNKGKEARCETLIIESTYGRSSFRFPSTAEVLDQANKLIASCFSQGIPVILMGYPLGKGQVLSYLFSSWEPIYNHGAVHRMNEVHRELGVDLSDSIAYQEAVGRGLLKKKPWVLITPVYSGRSAFIQGLKKKYNATTVAFSGWSVDPSYRYAMAVDYALPLSDHCDFDELIAFVKRCEPKKVYTVHGFASDLAEHLRKLGYDATPLLGTQRSLGDFTS